MAINSVTLYTHKTDFNNLSDRQKVNYTPEERGKILDVTVLGDDDKSPYDLTNVSIRFVDIKDGSKIVIDDGSGVGAGKFIRSNDEEGKFQYQLQDKVFDASGYAQFDFYVNDRHIDSTNKFRIEIDRSMKPDLDNTSYVSSLEELKDAYKVQLTDAKKKVDDLVNSTSGDKGILEKQLDELKEIAGKIDTGTVSDIKEEVKTISDSLKATNEKISGISTKGAVKSINGIKPDKDGNIDLPNADLSAYAKATDVEAELKAKADSSLLDAKANASDMKAIQDNISELQSKIKSLSTNNNNDTTINRFTDDSEAQSFMQTHKQGIVVVDN